jgi:hypothetical protein
MKNNYPFLHRVKRLIIKRKNLESVALTLPEAMQLASVLLPKIDLDTINPELDAVDFIGDLIDKLSPREYLYVVMLLTREDEETIKSYASIEILTAFITGLQKNQVVTLLGFYRSLNL